MDIDFGAPGSKMNVDTSLTHLQSMGSTEVPAYTKKI